MGYGPPQQGGGSAGIVLFKTATESRSSTIALAADAELVRSALSAGSYEVLAVIQTFSTSGAPGIRIGFRSSVAPSNSSMMGYKNFSAAGAVGEDNGAVWAMAPTVAGFTVVANQPGLLVCRGVLMLGSAADVAFQWAQNSSNATATSVRVGSYMILTPLAA